MIPRHGLGKIRDKRVRKARVTKLGEDNRERTVEITNQYHEKWLLTVSVSP